MIQEQLKPVKVIKRHFVGADQWIMHLKGEDVGKYSVGDSLYAHDPYIEDKAFVIHIPSFYINLIVRAGVFVATALRSEKPQGYYVGYKKAEVENHTFETVNEKQ